MSRERLVEIVMPQMGISVAEATLIGWRKGLGEPIAMDEPICDISSDKVDSEVPAPTAGRLVELLIAVGETVDVGTPIAMFETDTAPPDSPPDAKPTTDRETSAKAPSAPREARHSPAVIRLAEEMGVDLTTIAGSGAGGRVRREDVLAAAESTADGIQRVVAPQTPDAEPDDAAAPGEPPREPYVPPAPRELPRVRRLSGEHMKRSLDTAATVTQWIEVDFEAVEARRRELGVTALPVFAAATVATLAQFGDLNVWLRGEQYTRHEEVNLGIAVSLGEEGLIVPVIRSAQLLGVAELAAAIRDLAARARSHTLSPDEVRDGTFTITNPGQFGTLMATPVISQPQVAILDMEAIVRRPVVVGPPEDERIAIRPMCILGLSWDHRALDGAYAASFLAALRDRLQAA
jgi:pyruvate/2-oxoglutarate dehydrogenase complex dihydrolipoamide acyltransferase (E2) component